MKMQKRTFRIGELAKQLALERFVIRFWEKEFALRTNRSEGGQRFYTQDDLNTFSYIKELLYIKGFTITGAKLHMHSLKQKTTISKALLIEEDKNNHKEIELLKKERSLLEKQVLVLQQQLIKLRELL